MRKIKPVPPETGDCLPSVWAPASILAGVAAFTLLLIHWRIHPTAAVSTTSAVGGIAITVMRRTRLRHAWGSIAVLAIVATVTLLLIHWGFAPTVTICTISGIGMVTAVLTRNLFSPQPPSTAAA